MAQAASAAFQAMFGEPAAFRAWYDGALPKVYGFVLARCGGDPTLAVELTQEAFVEAVRHRARFAGESDPVTWVCGIARHKTADHFRNVERERRRLLRVVEGEPDHAYVGTPALEVDERAAVVDALAALPVTQRAVLAMHYLDGEPVREIAATLGRSESSVESLLVRAREGFRRAYRRGNQGEER